MLFSWIMWFVVMREIIFRFKSSRHENGKWNRFDCMLNNPNRQKPKTNLMKKVRLMTRLNEQTNKQTKKTDELEIPMFGETILKLFCSCFFFCFFLFFFHSLVLDIFLLRVCANFFTMVTTSISVAIQLSFSWAKRFVCLFFFDSLD